MVPCLQDGWQWLFLAEGLPTIAFGLWLRYSLSETPATAKFLRPEERTWLAARNEAHKVRHTARDPAGMVLEPPWRRAAGVHVFMHVSGRLASEVPAAHSTPTAACGVHMSVGDPSSCVIV